MGGNIHNAYMWQKICMHNKSKGFLQVKDKTAKGPTKVGNRLEQELHWERNIKGQPSLSKSAQHLQASGKY